MSSFVTELEEAFLSHAADYDAVAMAKYMKNNFIFLGLKTDVRRALQKQAAEGHTKEIKENARSIALQLYAKKEREYHYTAIDILIKELKKKFVRDDVELIEKLVVTHSWWDSVDLIAKYLVGGYLQQYPEEKEAVIARFSGSDNMWLNRSAILFQLGYKKTTDEEVLFSECTKHKDSKEFFIQKAIGWALREYAKINPEAVKQFTASASLKPLSIREALKNIKNNG